ncbi:Stp1/IreP family PP2C-type Ser/Thr phosphatase [Streptococcus dentiloxodontae]
MEISLLTDIGQKRSNNQDFVNKFVNKAGVTLVVLADGMGGHRAGNIASEMSVTDLGRDWIQTDLTDLSKIRDWMMVAVESENKKVYELGQTEDYKGMGTTIEVLALVENAVILAHVGDSRVGLIRNGEYRQLTSDHSLVNALIKAGQLTEEEAAVHPQRNIITQSVGQSGPVETDLAIQQLEPGDYILANSDGLTNMLSKEEIVAIVTGDGFIEEKTSRLIKAANEAGGLDNITVALIKVESEEG